MIANPPIIIAAVALNGAIGKGNALMWHLSDDMKFFKATTAGACVVMGRKTFESLGRPLPGRQNIVISRGNPSLPEGVQLAHSLEEALDLSERDNCFIIGGAQIYAQAMGLGGPQAEEGGMVRNQRFLAGELLITRVLLAPDDADAFFPEIKSAEWVLVQKGEDRVDGKSGVGYRFERYHRG